MKRLSFTLTDAMSKKVKFYAEKWRVSEAEVVRRLFGMGDFLADELENDRKKIYVEDADTKEKERIVFQGIG